MEDISMKKIVGDTFEDMSIAEMTMVQGSGDVGAEFTTSPACVALSVAATQMSSGRCAVASAGFVSLVSGVVVSAVNC